MNNKLIIIRGPLGIGKSTISKIISERINAKYLSLDKILDENNLIPEGEGIPLESFLNANKLILKEVTQNNLTIIDGCFYYKEQIEDLENSLKHNLIILSLTCSVEKCIERDSKREKVYGEDSARFVYMVTEKIKAGYYINTENLTTEETIEKALYFINKMI